MKRINQGMTPIGLDVSRGAIAAIQLRRDRAGLRIQAACLLERANPDAEAALTPEEAGRIEQVCYRQGFTGRDVVVGVPDSSLTTGVLELPPRSSGAPIEQLAKAELARLCKVAPDAIEAACWDVPPPARGAEGTNVMAACCKIADAEAFLGPLEQTGFLVRVLDARYWGMARACEPLVGAVRLAAILQIGHVSASLIVVCDKRPVYQRHIPSGGRGDLLRRIREAGDLAPEAAALALDTGLTPAGDGNLSPGPGMVGWMDDAVQEYATSLAAEVATATGYVAHRYGAAIERLILLGIGARVPNLAGTLGSLAEIPATIATPGALAECDPSLERFSADPALTTAFGLALADVRRAA